MRRLLGKVAIVTGAGSRFNEVVGVGQATAIKFADEGAKVLIVDKNLKAAKKRISGKKSNRIFMSWNSGQAAVWMSIRRGLEHVSDQ